MRFDESWRFLQDRFHSGGTGLPDAVLRRGRPGLRRAREQYDKQKCNKIESILHEDSDSTKILSLSIPIDSPLGSSIRSIYRVRQGLAANGTSDFPVT